MLLHTRSRRLARRRQRQHAVSLTDLLYYEHAWAFRFAGLGLLLAAVALHLHFGEGVCTLDEAKRQRDRIINLVGIAVVLGTLAYVFWLYVVVEIAGHLLGIW